MKKWIIILALVVISSALLWLLYKPQTHSAIQSLAGETNQATVATPIQQVRTNALAALPIPSEPTPESNPAAFIEKRLKQMDEAKQNGLNEWRTPIEFYGRVIDESNNVVPGAQIDFDCNDISPTGTSYYHTKSDVNGSFSLKNIAGKLLGVYVNKEGYYPYDPHGQNFYYAGQNQNFVPDAGNPVVFRLRKKGEGASLIHYDKRFQVPRDGTPILIDLATGKVTSSSGDAFQVEGWTYDKEKKQGWKYDWNCRVSVPSGGLQTNDEQFPFLAPESDYVSGDVIDMPVTNDVPWSYIIHRNYYVHTAGGNFGRMVFTMVAGGDNFCELNLFFNPSGSRNLEPH